MKILAAALLGYVALIGLVELAIGLFQPDMEIGVELTRPLQAHRRRKSLVPRHERLRQQGHRNALIDPQADRPPKQADGLAVFAARHRRSSEREEQVARLARLAGPLDTQPQDLVRRIEVAEVRVESILFAQEVRHKQVGASVAI